MQKRFTFLIYVLIPLLLFQCTSGKKAYERGDYYAAVIKAVDRLRSNPNHKKSKETLRKSYPIAVRTLETNATNSVNSNNRFKYKEALRAFEKINRMYEEIRRSPGALRIIPQPKDYYSRMNLLKRQAAEESYNEGLIALRRDTREDAKEAYYLFKDTNEFYPGFKDARDKMDEARFLATLKVIVEQIPVPSRYRLSANFFEDKIEEYLHRQFRSNELVRFYTPVEAKRENLKIIDQYLRLEFDDFEVGRTTMDRSTETVSRDSVKVGRAKLKDGTYQDVYNTVYAKITIYRKEVSSRGLFSMRVYDANTNAVLSHEKFNGEFVWYSEWGSFNGDERALTQEQLSICNQREVPPPPPQDMFIEFTRPIYDQLINEINRFYSKY